VQLDDEPLPLRVGPLEVELQALFTNTAKFDLSTCFATTEDGALTCRAEYSTELFDPKTIGRVLAAIRRVAEVADEDRPLSALPVERSI
jgi:hypothetical protein